MLSPTYSITVIGISGWAAAHDSPSSSWPSASGASNKQHPQMRTTRQSPPAERATSRLEAANPRLLACGVSASGTEEKRTLRGPKSAPAARRAPVTLAPAMTATPEAIAIGAIDESKASPAKCRRLRRSRLSHAVNPRASRRRPAAGAIMARAATPPQAHTVTADLGEPMLSRAMSPAKAPRTTASQIESETSTVAGRPWAIRANRMVSWVRMTGQAKHRKMSDPSSAPAHPRATSPAMARPPIALPIHRDVVTARSISDDSPARERCGVSSPIGTPRMLRWMVRPSVRIPKATENRPKSATLHVLATKKSKMKLLALLAAWSVSDKPSCRRVFGVEPCVTREPLGQRAA